MISKKTISVVFTILLVIPFTFSQTTSIKNNEKPNIIFILSDDLGYGDLGCYGQKMFNTPNIDQLASEGLKFTQSYAGSSVCMPSRSSFMTGLHTGHTRHRGNYGLINDSTKAYIGFERDQETIGTVMKRAGYKTAHIGKWHLGGTLENKNVAKYLGFDYTYGPFWNFLWTLDIKEKVFENLVDHYKPEFYRNGEKIIIEGNLNKQMQVYNDDLLTEDAINFISENKDSTFFMYLAYQAPHAPMNSPTEFPYEDKSWPEVERNFAATIYRLDNDIGKIVNHIKSLRLDKKTLIIFSSDNGPHNEGGHDYTFFDSNGQLRGRKLDFYEGGIRVPMIAWWPGTIKEKQETDHVCAFWDLLPTFAALGEGTVESKVDGLSFAPILLGNKKEQKQHEFLYWELHIGGFKQSVRFDNWKVIKLPDGKIEVYNLEQDISEQNDLFNKYQNIVNKGKHLFNTARTENQFWPVSN
ncbi:MAG: arylsulfatase [Cyclobacteriaceae bacterium]